MTGKKTAGAKWPRLFSCERPATYPTEDAAPDATVPQNLDPIVWHPCSVAPGGEPCRETGARHRRCALPMAGPRRRSAVIAAGDAFLQTQSAHGLRPSQAASFQCSPDQGHSLPTVYIQPPSGLTAADQPPTQIV